MGKVIKFNSAQKKLLSKIESKVSSDIKNYTSQYSASELEELKYLINEGFYTSLAEAIALDIFHSSDLEDITVFKKFSKKLQLSHFNLSFL